MGLSILDAGFPRRFWAEAVNRGEYIQNRLPSSSMGSTPNKVWFGAKPDLQHLKVYDCSAYVWIPQKKMEKCEEKATKISFVGYAFAPRKSGGYGGRVTSSGCRIATRLKWFSIVIRPEQEDVVRSDLGGSTKWRTTCGPYAECGTGEKQLWTEWNGDGYYVQQRPPRPWPDR